MDTFTYVVPSQGTEGQQICDRGVVVADDDGDGGDDGGGGGKGWGDNGGDGGDDGGGGGKGWGDNGGNQQHAAATSAPDERDGSQGGDDGDGDNGHVETSAILCYTVQAAVAPEAPMALMFPIAGLIVGGSSLVVYRRRRRVRPES